MYTPSNGYTRKFSSGTIIALLALSALLLLVPLGGVVRGSTGHAGLGFVDAVPTPTTFTGPATVNESVTAGSNVVTQQDGTACAGTCLFAIDLSGVTFSGTQFKLFISQDGFSQIGSGDIQYGPTFNVGDFSHSPTLKEVNATIPGIGLQHFYIGNVGGVDVVEGPIPIQISSSFNFVKIFDGAVTSVAVTSGQMVIVPGLTLAPTTGPAGSTLSATGGGFPSNTIIDLVYSYSTVFFSNSSASATVTGNWTTGINTTAGYWSFSGAILNAKQQILDVAGDNLTYTAITITAAHEASPHAPIAVAVFNENTGFLNEVVSLDTSGVVQLNSNAFALDQGFGNDNGTGFGPSQGVTYFNLADPNGVALGTLIISGNWSAVNSQVTFWVDGKLNPSHTGLVGGTQIGSATTNGAGFFNGTATLPILSEGDHLVTVNAGGVLTWFMVNIIPSLVLSPSHGPVGTTVSATAYGFPANSAIYLYWFEHSFGDATYYNLGNFSTGANGQFNVTVSFSVPHTYGGAHDVSASTGYAVNPTSVPAVDVADTAFTVTPTLTVSPASVDANAKGFIVASGTGFSPSQFYNVVIDHAWTNYIEGGLNGDLQVNFTSAGFRPGTHQLELTCEDSECSPHFNSSAPQAFAYFNVTLTGDLIGAQFASISTAVTSLQGSLTSIQSSLTAIQASLTTITSDVSGLGAQLTTITNDVTGLSSLSGQITSLSGKIDSLSSTLSSVTSSLSSIQSSISTAATNASNAATAAQNAATAASNASSGTSTAQTYVLVVAVLAAITLVLELAILVRKLS